MFEKHEPISRQPVDVLRHYLVDIVYGATDGIITTFAIISGVEGAKLAPLIVIILGFVNLFADGVSMGVSRFLSIRAGADALEKSRGVVEPLYHALVTFFAFVIFGLFPLASFLIPGMEDIYFFVSCIMSGLTLFFVGSLRFFISKKHWFRGGLEMLAIGAAASVIAYYVGAFIKSIV